MFYCFIHTIALLFLTVGLYFEAGGSEGNYNSLSAFTALGRSQDDSKDKESPQNNTQQQLTARPTQQDLISFENQVGTSTNVPPAQASGSLSSNSNNASFLSFLSSGQKVHGSHRMKFRDISSADFSACSISGSEHNSLLHANFDIRTFDGYVAELDRHILYVETLDNVRPDEIIRLLHLDFSGDLDLSKIEQYRRAINDKLLKFLGEENAKSAWCNLKVFITAVLCAAGNMGISAFLCSGHLPSLSGPLAKFIYPGMGSLGSCALQGAQICYSTERDERLERRTEHELRFVWFTAAITRLNDLEKIIKEKNNGKESKNK